MIVVSSLDCWDLLCLQVSINSFYRLYLLSGAFIAFLFFPYIGDWKGRKIGMIMANVMSMISALGVGLVPDDDINNIYFIMGFIVLGGFAFSGFEILCFSYTAEISGNFFLCQILDPI